MEARQETPVQAPYPWKWDMMIPSNVTDLATLAPKADHAPISARSFSCSSLVSGLSASDCAYMSQIGMAGQGDNVVSNNNYIWIGSSGPNTITFFNKANPAVGIILILWDAPAGDYQASFMNVRRPKISYSIPYGGSLTVSIANGVSGAWTALYDHKTILSQYGQIWNTWAEFTTGAYATVDISREIHMAGNNMNAQVSTGCLADLTHCAYTCKNGVDTCGTSGSYDLIGCTGVNTGVGSYNGNPSGGCYGWSNGGHIDASFF
ncbi:hypothetical protein GQ53DRAFT_792374 [Thozetella sp. PMI_491]|nr:hypothetical protein GQ53DRAFT_792374 [Thozetella sp. PMI_491]